MRNRWIKWGLLGLLVVLVAGMGVSVVYRSGPYQFGEKSWGSQAHRCDLTVFLAGGRAVVEGTDIYEAHNVRGWYYLQPPLFAIMMVPLAMVPQIAAVVIWYALNVLMILASVRMCERMISRRLPSGGNPWVLHVVPALLVAWLLLSTLAHGQSSVLMMWLVIAALYGSEEGHEIAGGMSLAGAALVKVFPIFLLGYFLWRKKWRLVAGSLLGLALGLLVLPSLVYGWQGNRVLLEKWVARVVTPSLQSDSEQASTPLYDTLLNADMVNNQSLPAVLWRWTEHSSARWIARFVLAAMVLTIVLVGRKSTPGNEPLIVGAMLICAVLAPPVSWAHYFLVLLYPLTVLVALSQQTTDPVVKKFVYASLGLYAALCFVGAARPVRGIGTLCVGAVVLWLALIISAARRRVPVGAT